MCQCKISEQARGGAIEVCARVSEAGCMARCIGSSSGLRAPSCSRGGPRAHRGREMFVHVRTRAAPTQGVEGSADAAVEVELSQWARCPGWWRQNLKHTRSRGKAVVSTAAVIDAICLQKKCAAGRSRHATSASTRAFSSVFYIEASSPLVRAAGATSATPSEKIEECMARSAGGSEGPGPPAAAEETLRAIVRK